MAELILGEPYVLCVSHSSGQGLLALPSLGAGSWKNNVVLSLSLPVSTSLRPPPPKYPL